MNIVNLYRQAGRPEQEIDLWLRYKAQRDFYGFQFLLPGITMEKMGIPGMQNSGDYFSNPLQAINRPYLIEPNVEMNRTKNAALTKFRKTVGSETDKPRK